MYCKKSKLKVKRTHVEQRKVGCLSFASSKLYEQKKSLEEKIKDEANGFVSAFPVVKPKKNNAFECHV